MGKLKEFQKCEICGNTATHFVRDLIQSPDFETGTIEKNPDGYGWHRFCKDHKRESILFDESFQRI